jgi:putative methylase
MNLAIALSRLKTFKKAQAILEQYTTDSQTASRIIHAAYMNKDIEGKRIIDLGCGNGILGIGCLILGAEKVIFLDIDKESISLTKENIQTASDLIGKDLSSRTEFIVADIKDIKLPQADMIIENPPFGTRTKNIDTLFLEKAVMSAPVIYTMHKYSTKDYIDKAIKKAGFTVTHFWRIDFPLKNTLEHHNKRIQYIDVGCWRINDPKT